MTARSNRELWMAFIAILFITLGYLFVTVTMEEIPAASGFFGHSIGILGFILMLCTESLYTLRKRSRNARWGRMASWLQFHIFTGIVGPYMVLLHTSWKFNGLAGIALLLTIIIVLSGFLGRYIYTAVPRSVDGIEIEASVLQNEIEQSRIALESWLVEQPDSLRQLARRLSAPSETSRNALAAFFGRTIQDWSFRFRWWVEKGRMESKARSQVNHLEQLISKQRILRQQLNSLALARRLLSLWHTIHIPIGMVLFTAAFIHMAAAIYYATLLR